MLSETMVRRIERLLSEGMRQRQVAALVGVSRGTVQTIGQGRHPYQLGPVGSARKMPVNPWLGNAEVGRCDGCGGTVTLPCLACRLREALEGLSRVLADEPGSALGVGFSRG